MVALPAEDGSIEAMMYDIASRGKELEEIVKRSPTQNAILQMPRLREENGGHSDNDTVSKFGLGNVFQDAHSTT